MSEPFARAIDDKLYVAFAMDAVTADSTAGGVPLTTANVQGAKRALISVETAQIRYSCTSATAPTASVGLLANPGDQIILVGIECQAFKAIRTTATSATLTVEYSR